MLLITTPRITEIPFQTHQRVPQQKVRTETHCSQEFTICKLPIQQLLFTVLACSVKDRCARRHRSTRKCQSQKTQAPSLARWTFQACNHHLVSHTTTKQLDAPGHHAFFQGHVYLLPARLSPKLHPKLPADTHLLMGTVVTLNFHPFPTRG